MHVRSSVLVLCCTYIKSTLFHFCSMLQCNKALIFYEKKNIYFVLKMACYSEIKTNIL